MIVSIDWKVWGREYGTMDQNVSYQTVIDVAIINSLGFTY